MSEVVGPKASQSQTVQVQQEQVQGRWRAQLLQKPWRRPPCSLVLHYWQEEKMGGVRRPKVWHRSECFNSNIVNISIRMFGLINPRCLFSDLCFLRLSSRWWEKLQGRDEQDKVWKRLPGLGGTDSPQTQVRRSGRTQLLQESRQPHHGLVLHHG